MAESARLDELRRRFEENPRRYFAPLASALRRGGDAGAAAALARAQLAVYPGHLTGHVILGHALLDLGDTSGARSAFDRAAALDPGNVVALQQLVGLARAAGDSDAVRHWTACLVEADPELAAEVAVSATRDDEDAGPLDGGFEPLDLEAFAEVPAPAAAPDELEPPAAAPLELYDDGHAVLGVDPVVGLDVPPADPIPAPMRDALPELLDLDEAPEPEPPTAAASETPSDGAAGDRAIVPPPAAPFVTETMAALLAAQGHTAEAADVYERLLAQRPDDERLYAELVRLRGPHAGDVAAGAERSEAGTAAADPVQADEPVEHLQAAGAAAQIGVTTGADDDAAARMWRTAFAPLAAAAQADLTPAAGAMVVPDAADAPFDPLAEDADVDVRAVHEAAAADAGDSDVGDSDVAGFDAAGFDVAGIADVADAARSGPEHTAHADPAPVAVTTGDTELPAVGSDVSPDDLATAGASHADDEAPPAADAGRDDIDDADEDLAQFNAWLRGLAE